ncbi:MAG: SDR family NAD(P)-dependent oxidoreductase [Xanthobacteraceae bacterium]
MSRIFITGSSDGLGLMAGRLLVEWSHLVTLHARNTARAEDTKRALPQADAVVIGDVSSVAQMRRLAEQVNALGRHDAMIHNVGVGSRAGRIETEDGLSQVFAVNVLAPYLLTALITRPDRLVYLSSGMHSGAVARLDDAQWEKRRWNGSQAYAESKLLDVMLAFAVARFWPVVKSNVMSPGWVATRMGGASAPGDVETGAATQAWLAVSDEPEALMTGRYFYHRKEQRANPIAERIDLQDRLLGYCAELSGVTLSGPS